MLISSLTYDCTFREVAPNLEFTAENGKTYYYSQVRVLTNDVPDVITFRIDNELAQRLAGQALPMGTPIVLGFAISAYRGNPRFTVCEYEVIDG